MILQPFTYFLFRLFPSLGAGVTKFRPEPATRRATKRGLKSLLFSSPYTPPIQISI